MIATMPILMPQSSSECESERRTFVAAALDDAGLSPAQFRVYCHLVRNRADFTPTTDRIASICQLRAATVRACIQVLEARRMIRVIAPPGRKRTFSATPASSWLPALEVRPGKIVSLPLCDEATRSLKREGWPASVGVDSFQKEQGDPSRSRLGDLVRKELPHKDTQSTDTHFKDSSLSLAVESRERMPSAKKGSSEEVAADPRHSVVTNGYRKAYQVAYGEPYAHQCGKDGSALKKLLKQLKPEFFTAERIVETAKRAMEHHFDRFAGPSKHAATLAGFASAYNEIRAELAATAKARKSGKAAGGFAASHAIAPSAQDYSDSNL